MAAARSVNMGSAFLIGDFQNPFTRIPRETRPAFRHQLFIGLFKLLLKMGAPGLDFETWVSAHLPDQT
jgi:hypothetical protein